MANHRSSSTFLLKGVHHTTSRIDGKVGVVVVEQEAEAEAATRVTTSNLSIIVAPIPGVNALYRLFHPGLTGFLSDLTRTAPLAIHGNRCCVARVPRTLITVAVMN